MTLRFRKSDCSGDKKRPICNVHFKAGQDSFVVQVKARGELWVQVIEPNVPKVCLYSWSCDKESGNVTFTDARCFSKP